MCSVPRDVLAHQVCGRAAVAGGEQRDQPPVLRVRAAPGPPRGGRCARSGRSSAPGPRSSRRPVGASGRPRRCRCGSACRRAGSRRRRSACHLVDQVARAGRGAPARRARRRGSPRRPRSRTRWSSTAQASSPSGSLSRSASGGRSATKVPPRAPAGRGQVAALDQRGQRLAQGRARDPQLARRARAPAAAGFPAVSRPSRIAVPSRSTVSSKVVGARTGLNTASRATSRFIALPYPLPGAGRLGQPESPSAASISAIACSLVRKWTTLKPSLRAASMLTSTSSMNRQSEAVSPSPSRSRVCS